MNHFGLTVFAGNIPGLIIDFDDKSKKYTVEFTDGRVVRTANVYWEPSIPAEPDIALYRKSSLGNGEQLVYDALIGWDVVSNVDAETDDDGLCDRCGGDGCSHCDFMGYHISNVRTSIDVVDEESDLDDWVDDLYDKIEDGIEKEEHDDEVDEDDESAVQHQDHDATEDSYWDRSTKPNPMAYDEEFPAGDYNERNPGTLNPEAHVAKKDCNCWEGYERVPGTEPCEPGSCEKCDAARKKESAAPKKKNKKQSPEEALKKVNRVPPAGVRAAAKRALKYIEEGKAGDGFQDATADRARRIAAGEELTVEHINRMHSFFERHAGGRSKKAKPGEVTAWDVAWLAWGGDAGRSWASKVDAQIHKALHPNSKGKHSADAGAGVFDLEHIEDDTDHMRSDIGGNSNVRHAEGEAQKNQHGDEEGNPEMRGVGGDIHFPDPPLDVAIEIEKQNKDLPNPNESVWERMFSHVNEESEALDEHLASGGPTCPECSDPLVDGKCYVCGEDKKKEAKKIAKRERQMQKVADTLRPRAAELGKLFGLALAGKTAVTEPSEGIFAIEIDGIDSQPEHGGTGGYNSEHGDSPEYLKDVDGYAGFIDATPDMVIEGMPRVIELSESDESGEDDKFVKALERFFDDVLGDEFTDSKDKAKKEKESSVKVASNCNLCNQEYVGGDCALKGAPPDNCPAINSSEDGQSQTAPMNNSQSPPMGYTQAPAARPSVAPAVGIPGAFSSVAASDMTDAAGQPIEEGAFYRVFISADDEPDIVRVDEVSDDKVSVSRVDSAFPDDAGQPYDITAEQFATEDIRFSRVDEVNPNEVGMDSAPATDGTPETMDDAGPGHNDIPGVTDLSSGRKARTEHTAGRHYYPNQQKEFINEHGKARNLDKLILEGTHYEDNEVTASDEFDDNFLFGV